VILAAATLLLLLFWLQPEIVADVLLVRAQAWAAFVTDALVKAIQSTVLHTAV